MNLYGFVGNDSVNGWDYLGLKCDPLDMAAAGIRGAAVGFAKAYAFKKVVTTGAKILVSQSVPGVGQAAGIAMVGWEVISLGHTGYQIYVNSGTIKAEVMSVLEDGKLKQQIQCLSQEECDALSEEFGELIGAILSGTNFGGVKGFRKFFTKQMKNAKHALKGGFGRRANKVKTDFYIAPDGTAMPSTAYRYMDSKYATQTMESMQAPGSYFTFKKFDNAADARSALQGSTDWSDAKLLGEFDTLQLGNNWSIPKAFGGKGPGLEPITNSYPQYGIGGYPQLKTDMIINFDKVELLK